MNRIKSNFDKLVRVLGEILTQDSAILKKQVKPGPKTKFSDLEVVALSCTAEYMGYDSENYFFSLLNKNDFPGLLSRRQFNDRRKKIMPKLEEIRKLAVSLITKDDKLYVIDSMPLKLCRYARWKRNKIGQDEHDVKPNVGYCASQQEKYFGYKLHAVCSSKGVIEFFDITAASFSDVQYLPTVAKKLKNAYLIGDKGYISQGFKHLLRMESKVHIFTDSKINAKKFTAIPPQFKGKRKKIETIFSQLTDQFNIQKNYTKTATSYFTRITSKILSMTLINYVNHSANNKSLSQIKYAL